MDQETKLLLDAFETYKKELKIAFRCELPNPKDSKASEEIRKEGNTLFLKKNHTDELHKEILSHYNESAALAPSASQELASAYANRSAFLLHVGKYEEGVQDIDKALEITESIELKVKLLCRKVECLKNMGITCENELDKALSFMDNIDKDDKNKQVLKNMISKAAKLLVAQKAEVNLETNESINLPVTDNPLKKVSIRHNKKYGRHLVAEKNYNPGDIIFVEKLFSSSVKPLCRYTNCHYCLKDCWNGVPCDYCDWAIFCSKECSQKAWKEYHDIECSVGSLLNCILDLPWIPSSMIFKIFIKAMKDAGSVQNLRAQLKAVDRCTDPCSKGFYKDRVFTNNTVESFYSLKKRKLSRFDEKVVPRIVLVMLIGLLKHPRLKYIFPVKKVKDLIENNDIVFLGSLLIRFTAIRFNNSYSFVHNLSIYSAASGVTEAPRGSCLALLASLINNSCCPNANVCFTKDGKAILYAVQPIKKDSQIFVSYSYVYYAKYLKDRKKELQSYNFECDCEACTESWPPVLLMQVLSDTNLTKKDSPDAKFMRQCCDVADAIVKDDYSRATLEKLVVKIILAFKCLKQPSTFTCMMLDALNTCVSKVYNGLEPQTFGECKKFK